MNPGVSAEQAVENYERAYQEYFGSKPKVRKIEGGRFSVKCMDGGYHRFSAAGLKLMTGLYEAMLLEIN